ncbi:MAG: NifU family protein [Bacteroidetes bacterium]|nr:MAG: NifU family protein [Bacteroidota bacterium]
MSTAVKYSIVMEQTPNPETIRFITNYQLVPLGKALEFENHNQANVSPLARELFAFPFVRRILIAENYISITKQTFVLWDDILLELRDYLYEYLNSGKPVFDEDLLEKYSVSVFASENKDSNVKKVEPVTVQHNIPKSEAEQKIIDILNEYIMPAVSQDGGFITFQSYQDGVVYLKMRGACSGCPSSIYTLKAGIEALLKKMLPDIVKEVRSDNE